MKMMLLSAFPQANNSSDTMLYLITSASPVVKFILLLLLFFSVFSWAIIIFKLFEYRKARRNSAKFIDFFRKTKNFAEIHKFAGMFPNNPLARIFKQGYKELSLQMGSKFSAADYNAQNLGRSLSLASSAEITRLERLNGFLATTAAVTPFIGLFGTVWGIMDSFLEIGKIGNANLATVAPGIAEALIATALGLFAAIPAVIFYNMLLNKLKVLIGGMEDFITEFLIAGERLQ